MSRVGNVEILRMKDRTLRVNIFFDGKWYNNVTAADTYENRAAILAVARQANCAHSAVRKD